MEKADENAGGSSTDKDESSIEAKEKLLACDNVIQGSNISTSTLEIMENLPDAIKIKTETRELTIREMEDEELNEIEEGTSLSATEDAIVNIRETKNPCKISSDEVITDNKNEGEDAGESFGVEKTNATAYEQNVVVEMRAISASSIKECMASVFEEDNITNSTNNQYQVENPCKAELINQKCHNLSISELRKKLAFCPICQIQYNNHKMANMCLAKHGKRQCWLCLDILSSKKDDFYRHCIEYHSISKNGDIVGCPFCGKYFDFRQGLNQHIVKIHFAESISDLDAVASLSPTTLVDIFTGKPRTSSSSSEDIQCQHLPFQNDYRSQLPVTFSGAERDQYDPIDICMEYANVETSLSIPPVSFSESQQHKEQTRSPCTGLSSLSRSFIKTADVLQSTSDIIANFPRPSVIALLGNSMKRMSVPPEQTLSSLIVEVEPKQTESIIQQQNNNPFEQVENNVEIVENSCLRLQKSRARDFDYSCFKSTRLPSMQLRVAPKPEKFDFSVQKDFRACTTNATSSYEQLITRVSNAFQQQTHNQSLITQPFVDIEPNNGQAATSNSHLDGVDMFSEANKGYHNSIGSMLRTVADMEFNDRGPDQHSIALSSQNGALASQMDSASFSCSNACQKTGRTPCLNQEIELNYCDAPKFPDNCGVKRRILMKAMWDEHQFKKPLHSHSLVHDLNAATSLLAPPPSQKSSNMRAVTFNRGYDDDFIINGNRNQQNIPQMPPTSRIESKKDAGPFFEQYVREDRRRQGIPFKLLDLARAQDQAHRNVNITTLNNLSSTSTSGGHVYNNPSESVNHTNSCANSNSISNSWQYVPPAVVPRAQNTSNSNYLRGRRPSNPAFWDGLRARLMGSQSLRQANSGGNSCRSTFQNPTSYYDCRYSGRQAVENIIVQNPFEEETSLIQKTLSNKTSFVQNDARSKGNRSRIENENGVASKTDKMFFGTNIANCSTTVTANKTEASIRHHPYYAKSTTANIYTSAQQTSSNGCDSRMADMMTFTHFGPTTNRTGIDETRIDACSTHPSNLQQKYCDPIVAQGDPQTNYGQPLLIAPRYAEQYHQILHRLHNMDKTKLCK
ncbi:unnamed protein product [Orchesella dallaii]|uniref:C2H2-type domain-containing protein n=1 Tax=Orchesella dallaii TaxID=48710 RepID=A0ABP1QVQ7_9HEXA